MPRSRTAAETFATAGDAVKDGIRKALPGIVTQVTGQTCSVQLAVKNPLWRWENDVVPVDASAPAVFEDAPVLVDVPIAPLRAGGFVVWMPVAVGDCVLVVFSDLSTDAWRESDGSKPVQPGFLEKHTHDSPYCLPLGTNPDSQQLQTAPAGKLVVGKDGSNAQLVIDGTTVSVGASPTGFLALATLVNTELNKIKTTLATALAPAGAAGGPVTYGTPYSPSDVSATVAKGQ